MRYLTTLSPSVNTAPNGVVINELEMIWNKRLCPYQRTIQILLDEMRKSTKSLNQDSRCPGWDSNGALPEYMSELLPLDQPARRL
jgi:hypothetical protein